MTEDQFTYLFLYKHATGAGLYIDGTETELAELESAWLSFLCQEKEENSFGWEL